MRKDRSKQKISHSHLTELEKTFLRWKGIQLAEKDIWEMKRVKLGEKDERTD